MKTIFSVAALASSLASAINIDLSALEDLDSQDPDLTGNLETAIGLVQEVLAALH